MLLLMLGVGDEAAFAEQRQSSCTICVSLRPLLRKPVRHLSLSTRPFVLAQRRDSLWLLLLCKGFDLPAACVGFVSSLHLC